MRTISFRGKTKYGGDGWIYSESITLSADGEWFIDEYPVKAETIGGFSDLYDKYRVPIYEGDIVLKQLRGGACVHCEVVFKQGRFIGRREIGGKMRYYGITGGRVEVVGNIHDNPELLNQGGDNCVEA